MVQLKYKSDCFDKSYKNVLSHAKAAHSLAVSLDILTINGSESGPLVLSKYKYNKLLSQIKSARVNLEFAEGHLRNYLNKK
jgi:hypothetical protein